MLEGGATHVGVATDHVIESFRNALWPGYKTGEGIDPLLYAQFQPLEDALEALGVVVWPMVEFEADDALAAAAAVAAADARVEQVVVCTPDKDLAQCVRGDRIVQLDRRTRDLRNESAVRQKFGVSPSSTSRSSPRSGTCPCAERCGWPRRSRSNASARSCSGSSRRCVRMRPSAPTSMRSAGWDRALTSRPGQSASARRRFTSGLRCWRPRALEDGENLG